MNKFILLLIIHTLFINACAQKISHSEIEIVESVPIETPLDNMDIRNTYEVWLEMIGQAKYSLDIEQFYISNEPGRLLENVLGAIVSAADRGVKVRIIVDAKMYSTYPTSVDTLGKRKNIETRKINFGKISGGVQHAKYFIVDDEEVFIGSQNFDWRALEHIHEIGLRIRNKDLACAFKTIFEIDWTFTTDTVDIKKIPAQYLSKLEFPVNIILDNKDTTTISPTFSPIGFIPDSLYWDEKAIVNIIDNAKRTLFLQFLSYSPFERKGAPYNVIDDAIRNAANRGVKVQMIVSDWQKGTSAVKALKGLSANRNIEVAFSSIPEWSGGYISYARVEHCKFIVADNCNFWLGTSNCSKNYFYSSRNLGVAGKSKYIANTLSNIFIKSWLSSYKELIAPNIEYKARFYGDK